MPVVDDLTIDPVTLEGFPKRLLNNWARKVELETAYITSVDTLSDGTEVRTGLKVRPRRFLATRLTSMDFRDMSRLNALLMRLANQTVPMPLYQDMVEVTHASQTFFGEFSNTRFFIGARVLHVAKDHKGVSDDAFYTVEQVTDTFVVVTEVIGALNGVADLLIPLMDVEIELRSLTQTMHTACVGSVDLNVNERMDESALVPLTTPLQTVLFEDDFNSVAVDPGLWSSETGDPTVVEGSLRLQEAADTVTSISIGALDSFLMKLNMTVESFVDGDVFEMEISIGTNTLTITKSINGVSNPGFYVQLNSDPVVETINEDLFAAIVISRNAAETLLTVSAGSQLLGSFSTDIDGTLSVVVLRGRDTADIRVQDISVVLNASRIYSFNPRTYKGSPILEQQHNWLTDPVVDIFRYGTKALFGRGRLSEVESSRPQSRFSVKASMDRQAAFSLLRFFDYARGRLAPFFYVNPQNVWELVEVRVGEIVVKGYSESADDIQDFYRYASLKSLTGDELVEISSVVVEGDNFVIQTVESFPLDKTYYAASSGHFVRFSKDSIREVWTNRNVCEVSFGLIEVLEDVETLPLPESESLWGGLPDEGTLEFVFGGFPDTVYELDTYWGGNP